jgi:hypothetical protein
MQVNVNGKSFTVPNGANVSIINNVLYVDGQEYTGDGYESKQFKIEITGGVVANVKVERGDVTVHGDAGSIDAGGSVTVSGSVSGKVDAGGSVNCGNVSGDVDAGGSVNCGSIGGDVDAGGSVHHK